MDLISNNTFDLAVLASLVAEDGPLDGASLALFKNDVEPDRSVLRAGYTDADYTGNGDEAITWGVPSVSDDGTPEVIGIVGEFRPTGTTIGNTIFGGIIVSAADALLMAVRFDDAVPMSGPTDSLIVTLRVRLTAGGLVVSVS